MLIYYTNKQNAETHTKPIKSLWSISGTIWVHHEFMSPGEGCGCGPSGSIMTPGEGQDMMTGPRCAWLIIFTRGV